MATNTPFLLDKKIQAALLEFQKQACSAVHTQWGIREQMRQIDLQYMREKDGTADHVKAKIANYAGDATKFQNVTVPMVLPAVEAAVTYQTSVFLTGYPIFGCVASPEHEDAAMQIEALMEEHGTRGGWARQIAMAFRDGFKYNRFALEVSWEKQTTAILTTDSTFGKQGKPTNIIWEGNCIKRLDPYNVFWDPRVPITEVAQHGEFAGYTEIMSRVKLKAFINSLPAQFIDNIAPAFESGKGPGLHNSNTASYYIPSVNGAAMLDSSSGLGGTDWNSWFNGTSSSRNGIKYQNVFEVSTTYARIIPSDFNIRVPSPNHPQIWKFIWVNNQHLIYAERQTNAHNTLGIVFGQPLEDGMSYQTKSLASNVVPLQEVASALINSSMAARRRAVSDRGLYDPSRVSERVINSDNPSAKMPVRPAAYGKPLSEAYYAIPFRDDQSGIAMSELGTVVRLSDMVTGSNPAKQGQFVKGNKTQTEFSDVMNHSNGRDETTALLLEEQVFTPVKLMLKLNILQYQGPASIYYQDKKTQVTIDPVKLRQAVVAFKITDGKTPASKQINADTLQVAMQVIGSSPQIGAGYNIGPMFSYLIKTQGGHIGEFEKSKEQVAYEQASQSWNALAQLALSKGQEWTQPQPTPEQFGYLQNGKLKQTEEKPDALQTFLKTLSKKAEANPADAQAPPPPPI